MGCINLRVRTKIGSRYNYCVLKRIKSPDCGSCEDKEYKCSNNDKTSTYEPKKTKIRPIDKLNITNRCKRGYLSNAVNITQNVRNAVWLRDNGCCVLCGNHNAQPNAHIISRSHLGLGIEQNIVTLCNICHYELDFTRDKEKHDLMIEIIEKYMCTKYDNWDKIKRVYKKGE